VKVFLVRNFHDKRLLGLFWAQNNMDLWWEVDGSSDPSNYEYASIRHGGLYFAGTEPVLDQAPEPDLTDPGALDEWAPKTIPWQKATPSEHLWRALHSNSDLAWRRFPYADQPGGGVHEVISACAKRHRPPA